MSHPIETSLKKNLNVTFLKISTILLFPDHFLQTYLLRSFAAAPVYTTVAMCGVFLSFPPYAVIYYLSWSPPMYTVHSSSVCRRGSRTPVEIACSSLRSYVRTNASHYSTCVRVYQQQAGLVRQKL
jgi:hypothetical protein